MVGFGFASHGYAKLIRGPENFASILTSLGVPQPHLMACVTSLLELVGGISLMAGAFVLPLSLPLAVVMLTACSVCTFNTGISSIRLKVVTASGAEFGPIGYEMNLLYIVALLTLAIGGPRMPSVDHWLATRREARTVRRLFPSDPVRRRLVKRCFHVCLHSACHNVLR